MTVEKDNILLSIIVPVYNGLSEGLRECLESIWRQGLDSNIFEVICIDDCSLDDSKKWIRAEQSRHTNLRLVENKVNVRQGGARNAGIREAVGKYLMFIDQDDFYADGALCKVRDFIMGADLDTLFCDSVYCFKGCLGTKLQLDFKHQYVMSGEEFIKKNGYAYAPWRFVVNREFYNSYDIKFVENCRIEDVDWSFKLIYYAKKMQYQPILLIYYIKSDTGTMDTMHRNYETLLANVVAANRTYDLVGSLYKDSSVKDRLADVADSFYNRSCRSMLGFGCHIDKKLHIISMIPEFETKC
ncbi:MAG: glycosyltransferase family 2 protein [Rikenellaceae bacterium]